MAKKVKPKVLTFAQLCKIAPPTILTPNQSACITELTDCDKNENKVTHTKSAVLKFKDTAGDLHKASFIPLGAKYLGSFSLGPINQKTDTLTWTFKVDDAVLDSLACGQTLIQQYKIAITDACGKKAFTVVTIKIVGTNDAPCITSGPQIGKVTEISECAPPKCDDEGPVPHVASSTEGGEGEVKGGDCDRGPKDDDCGKGENETTHEKSGVITFKDVDNGDTHTADIEFCGESELGGLTWSLNNATDKIEWTFKVDDADIDHLKPGETVVQIYKVTITDKKGATATTTIKIVICGTDDGVKISGLDAEGADICVDESSLPDRGEGESEGSSPSAATLQSGNFTVDAPDGLDTIKIDGVTVVKNNALTATLVIMTDHGKITVTGFDKDTGKVDFTYELLDNVDNDAQTDGYYMEKVQVAVTDLDGSCAKADLDIKIKDDVPSITPSDAPLPCLVVDESDLDDDASADFSGAFDSVPGADGATVTYALAIEGDGSTGLTDSDGNAVTLKEVDGVIYGVIKEGTPDEATAFIVSVDADGKVTLDQKLALDHPDDTKTDEPVSLTAGNGKILLVGTIADHDTKADTDAASIDITGAFKFEDDAPQAKDDCDYVDVAPIQVLTFDDIVLPASDEAPLLNYGGFTWAQTGVHNPTPPSNYVPTSGDQLAFFAEAGGSDVDGYPGNPGDPASASGGVFNFLGASFVSRNVANMPIVVTGYLVGGGTVTKTIYAQQGVATYVDFSTDPDFAGKALTKIEFDADNYFGFDNFTTRPSTPAATGNVVTGSDADNQLNHDGNTDDGVADDLGADGFGSIAWEGETGGKIVGQYGTLYVDAAGNYKYVVNADDPDVIKATAEGTELVETFDYTVKDKDGDPSEATLTIKVKGANDPVTINGLGVDGGEIVVDEDDLSDGSSPNAPALIKTGTFTIDAPDGIDKIVIAGVDVPLDGTPVPVPTPQGNSLLVSFAGGVVSYTYTLLGDEAHPSGNGQNTLPESLLVTVTGNGGTTATATLDVTIIDDVPTASDEASQTVAEGETLTGMLDFVQGADGATVTHINGTVLVFNPADDDYSQSIDIGAGSIKVRADGSYSFTADNPTNSPVPPITATYTVTDGDGDTSTANIGFQVTDKNKPTSGNAAASVDDDGLTGSNALSTSGDLVDSNADGDNNEATFSGTLGGSVGLDQPGTFSFAALHNTQATVGQETVTLTWAAGILTATGPRGPLFKVEITNAATGAYKVTLLDNVLHATGNNENDATVNLGYVIADSDGSTANGTLTVTFDDDAPTAVAGADLSVSEKAGVTNGINLLLNDAQGADDATVTSVQFGASTAVAINAVGTTVVNTANGQYVFQANGTWTFDPSENASNLDQTETFTYTITDRDGDTSSAAQKVIITNANSVPTAGSTSAAVDDEGLANGIAGNGNSTGDAATNSATATGTLPHDFGGDGKAAADPINFSAMHGTSGTVGTESVTYAWNPTTNTLTATSSRGDVFKVQVDGGADNGTGNYTVTLLKPILHATGDGENDATVNLTYSVKDSNNDSTNGTLTITFDDDTPLAKNDTAEVQEGAKPTLNAVLVIDLSLSMDGNSGVPGVTRLELLQQAVENYLNSPDVTFKDIVIYTFNDGAILRGTFTDVAAAIAHVNGYDSGDLVAATEYDSTLAVIQGNLPTLQSADQTHLLFLSDGDPVGGSDVNGGEEAAWSSFLDTRGVDKVIAVGFGGIVNTNFLDPVAPRSEDSAIAVTNANQLEAVLEGTLPGEVSGNVLTNDGIPGAPTADAFGADGGYISELTVDGHTYTFNGSTIGLGGNPDGATVNGTTLTVETDLGGTLSFNFATGAWEYDAPPNGVSATTDEVFGYKLRDNDGDTDTATLTVKVVDVPNVAPVLALNEIGATANYRDDFSPVSYSGSDGSTTWAPAWTETNDDNNVSGGDVRVVSSSGGRLQFGDDSNGGDSTNVTLTRAADLTGAISAVLSFSIVETGADSNEDLVLEAWNGTSWVEIETFDDDTGTQPYSVQLDPQFIGAHTQIRFRLTNELEQGEFYYIDNVDITYVPKVSQTNYDADYVENGAPISIAAAGPKITDADDTQLASAKIVLTNAKAGDVLSVGTLPGGIGFTIDTSIAGKITVNLTGAASLAAYQDAIKAVTFHSTSENPSEIDRIIHVTVNDGQVDSNVAQSTIHVDAVNDGLSATGDNIIVNMAASSGAEFVVPLWALLFNDSDPDGDAAITTSNPNDLASALVSVTGITVKNNNDSDWGSFQYTLSDGTNSDTGNIVQVSQDTSAPLDGTSSNDILIDLNAADTTLNGGNGNDVLIGNIGNDTLNGGNDNDLLAGGLGNDNLDGGSGNDVFFFNTTLNGTTNVDTITSTFDADPSGGQDLIRLDNQYFAGLAEGTLSAANFVINGTGTAGTPTVIYNSATGALSFDADGQGGASAIRFATINSLSGTLDHTDFFIV